MSLQIERTSARAWPDEQMEALFAEGFPAFITADREVKKHIGRVRELFAALDIMLVDGDEPVATGWGVPIAWTGDVEDLPVSFADILRRAVEAHDRGLEANALVIGGGVVHPARKGTGLAADLVRALAATGRENGLPRVLAPVRPTLKHLYPLTPIEEYAAWTRDDGLPFDPWLRLHVRLGARVIALSPTAQTMTGTVAEWQAWTGLELPASGEYVVPLGHGVLRVDRTADRGEYVEANVWVEHA